MLCLLTTELIIRNMRNFAKKTSVSLAKSDYSLIFNIVKIMKPYYICTANIIETVLC